MIAISGWNAIRPGRTITSMPANPTSTASHRAGPTRSPSMGTDSAVMNKRRGERHRNAVCQWHVLEPPEEQRKRRRHQHPAQACAPQPAGLAPPPRHSTRAPAPAEPARTGSGKTRSALRQSLPRRPTCRSHRPWRTTITATHMATSPCATGPASRLVMLVLHRSSAPLLDLQGTARSRANRTTPVMPAAHGTRRSVPLSFLIRFHGLLPVP